MLEALKRKRGGLKSRMTCIINKIDNSDVSDFYAIEKQLDEVWAKMSDLQDIILEQAIEEQEYNTAIEDFNIEESRFLNVKIKLASKNRQNSPESTTSCSHTESTVNLPQLGLPVFAGNKTEWATFSDLFKAAVHDKTTLTNAQKMQYLKSALKEDAEKIIKHLPVSNNNYQEAWDLLRRRYEDQRRLANNLAQRIIALPTLKGEMSLCQILDRFNEASKALKALLPNGNYWELIASNLIINCLERETFRAWELSRKTTEVPTLQEVIDFVELHAKVKDDEEVSRPSAQKQEPVRCMECKGNHILRNCPKFEKMNVERRWDIVKKNNLCRNCLSPKHSTYDCKSSKCRKCQKGHHTSLHREPIKEIVSMTTTRDEVLLPTAVLEIIDSKGKCHKVRALLDSGSQINLISRKALTRLNLKTSATRRSVKTVSGVCQLPMEANLTIRKDNWQQAIRCFVTDQLNIDLPAKKVRSSWQHLEGLQLADPDFGTPRAVDIIIGMGIISSVLTEGLRKGRNDQPIAQNSRLGWIISGPTLQKDFSQKRCFFTTEITEVLKQFWEVEEIPSIKILTEEEKQVELIFQQTTVRTDNNQYEVKYPFVKEPLPLGDSKEQAIHRFLKLEQQLERKNLRNRYNSVIKEYLELGHMIPVNIEDKEDSSFYLPHHAVFKESLTTNLRIVFDASAKTTNGSSLNDVMLNGPRTQEDLFHILIRFQTHAVALCADIEKMYRQVLVHPSHQKYQRIIWRDNRHEPLQEFQLTRVTFGMKSAPYLATRTLQQLADDEGTKYPQAREIVKRDFYVDDLLTGAHSVEAAKRLQKDLTSLLQVGGFHLRKWCSNNKDALENIVQDDSGTEMIPISADETVKTLGLHWNPKKDKFIFLTKLPVRKKHSKRTLLSDTAKIFDPMGWLSPIVIQAKIMFQSLWCQSLTWDQELPTELNKSWIKFRDALIDVQYIEIPRSIASEKTTKFTLCGFCDASQKAYGAVLYLRIEQEGERKTKLLVAKSRVSPLKILSVPRLELCAAVLLTRLVKETKAAMKNDLPTLLWTDSEIVLHWIRRPAANWKTFVANRVMEIQTSVSNCSWYHVKTKENPADLISRGVTPKELNSSLLWWNGPSWLQESVIPRNRGHEPKSVPESRKTTHVYSTIITENFIEKYSSLDKLLRITVWMQRFIRRTRKIEIASNYIQVQELRIALTTLIKVAQQEFYFKEIQSLRNQKPLKSKSLILNLAPFLDSEGVLRVGGRIKNSKLIFDRKHQILLPPKHHLTSLILNDLHIKNLHAGPQLLLNTLRQKYWIPRGRAIVRLHTRKCVTCIRQQASRRTQLMGSLPSSRVTPSRPFLNCGVDYCGPFQCKQIIGRGQRTHKAFIAVFICLVTRAVHVEVVSALSMDAFLAALYRFTARRGLPAKIYSDNGRNFVAAQKYIKELYAMIADEANSEKLSNSLASRNIQWQFIPPYSPHFGGLWEAAVKSLKFHLRRICGQTPFTFEELSTIATRIEACLNSRPIHPLSEDINDLEALTPGHFLIGEPLNSIPEDFIEPTTPMNQLSRYRFLQKLIQDLWKRWHSDYLTTLQARTKWKAREDNQFHCGDLVVIKDPNSSPQQWNLGRITATSTDSDGVIRVVSIQTAKGPVQRTINNIIKLPTTNN